LVAKGSASDAGFPTIRVLPYKHQEDVFIVTCISMLLNIGPEILQLILLVAWSLCKINRGKFRLVNREWKSIFDGCVTQMSVRGGSAATSRYIGNMLANLAKKLPNVTELIIEHGCLVDLVHLSHVLSRQVTTLTYVPGETRESTFPKALNNLTSLRTLNLNGCKLIEVDIVSILREIPNLQLLETLDLGMNHMGPIGSFALFTNFRIKGLTSLTKLDLSYNRLGDPGSKDLAEVLPSFSLLNHLNLLRNHIGREEIATLTPALESLTALCHLDLSFNFIRDIEASRNLAAALMSRNLISLRELILNDNYFGCEGLAVLAPSLERLVDMRVLELGNNLLNTIGDMTTISFSFLTKLINLIHLNLGKNSMTACDLGVLVDSISSLGNLRRLNLQGNSAGAPHIISSILQAFGRLEELDLSTTWMNASSLESMVPFVHHFTGLRSLDFSNNNFFSDEAGELLASVLQHMKYLKRLSLGFTHIKPHVFARMVPSLRAMRGMQELVLRGNSIDASGAAVLASVLENLTCLESLCLHMNCLKSSGVEALLPSLSNLEALETLNLGYNSICGIGAVALTSFCEKASLRRLDLHGNSLGVEGRAALGRIFRKNKMNEFS
jgi:Ran GTPase-activating protein (RanGAP) involved in mRNA processing and transport